MLAAAGRGVTWAQFFSGRVGAAWDPRRLDQMSTSLTGGTFGTVLGDTVGFVVDQARGGTAALGAELVTNGGFDSDTNWTKLGLAGIAAGVGSIPATATFSAFRQTILNVGSYYSVSFTISNSSGSWAFNLGNGTLIGGSGNGTFYMGGICAGDSIFQFRNLSGGAFDVDNISVRELPGCHMAAPTDARRATLVGYNGGSTPALYASGSHGYASRAALDLSASNKVTLIAQVRGLIDADFTILEAGANWSAASGTFWLYRSTDRFSSSSRGTSGATRAAAVQAQPDNAILVMQADIGAPSLSITRNGVAETSTATQGSGNYGNHIINWMARNLASPSLFATAEFGTTAIIGGALTTDELATAVALAAY